ncbi:MAG: cytochrome b5 [Deltaproteobacteria bacterium]|nr:cytochrome b5 [Deltaproteobacteria bacterium]
MCKVLPEPTKTISAQDLAAADGKEGRPAYICHQGRVFDVTPSRMWKNGDHMRRHHAGEDLSKDFQDAPHGQEVFERYPQVGVLEGWQAPAPAEGEAELPWLVQKIPFLKRHPHPMTVHFPLAFSITSPLFALLYLLFGWSGFDDTLLVCLGVNVVVVPVVIVTGLFTWWFNYQGRAIAPVVVKLILSPVLWGLSLGAFLWRLLAPELLSGPAGPSWVYLALVAGMLPVAGVIGWFGATLTFPLHGE